MSRLTLNARLLILTAAGGSAALMLGALAFQYLGDMPPCNLCYWQRYPHIAAVLIGIAALVLAGRLWPLLGALAAGTTAAIALYHTGVERGWWDGPSTCSASGVEGLNTEELLNQIMSAPLVRCDEVPWEMLGLSMASWNGVASLALMGIWLMAAQRS